MYALVTGASRGIGRAIAIRLAADGYSVLINFRSREEEARQTQDIITQAGGSAELLPFDVADPAAVNIALSAWQEQHPDDYIAVLVNNAGIRSDELLVFMEEDNFRSVLETNLMSFYSVTKPLLAPMIRKRFGRIINMASLSGLKGLPGQVNYSASKGGLIAATKALAQEVAKKKITVNAVAPGFVRTDMVEGLDEAALKQQIPVGRFGEAEEVAALVSFLASKEASYITGECININGGLYS